MKKIIFCLAASALFFACGSNDKATSPTNESGPNTTNVQNVNGNQPDTNTGITLDNRQSADTTKKDSATLKR